MTHKILSTNAERPICYASFIGQMMLGAGMLLASYFAHAAIGDIGTYTSSTKTFSTASYWIEGTDGVVMIDTQFLPKEGLEALALAEKITGKKVSTAIVLHPNPDKFNGTAVYQARGIKVVTSKQVAELIPAVHKIRYGWFFDEYKPDYPKDAAEPSLFGESITNLRLHGLNLKLHVLGKGASGAHVVVEHQKSVFVGDLINPSNHAWLELGLIGEWLARLHEIKLMQPTRIFPGRGLSGDVSLIDGQAQYLRQVQTWVREDKPSGKIGFLAKRTLQNKIEQAYPKLGYPIFMRDGLPAVWETEGTK